MATHTLELKNVVSGYNGKPILHNISFKAKESSIYVVLGPNGAGKTTLFRTIGGILEPFSGEILLDGESITKDVRNRINYLSHYTAVPEEMTVYGALNFYADMEGGNADDVLPLFNLEELKNKKVADLSQGQKQKVSIAKVFIKERDLYLLDEPTANLDPQVSKEIREIILKLSKDKIILYSSHNLYEASDIGGNLILIKDGTIGLFDKISNIKSKEYRYGIKASKDISDIVDAKLGESGYYILNVKNPEEAALALKKIVSKGILVSEMKRMDNPLQELFDKGLDDGKK